MKAFTVTVGLGAWFVAVAMVAVEARDTVNIPCWGKQACSACPEGQRAASTDGFCCPCCIALCSKFETDDSAICEVPTEMMNCTVPTVTSSEQETTVTMATKMTDGVMRSNGQTGAQFSKTAVVVMLSLVRAAIHNIP